MYPFLMYVSISFLYTYAYGAGGDYKVVEKSDTISDAYCLVIQHDVAHDVEEILIHGWQQWQSTHQAAHDEENPNPYAYQDLQALESLQKILRTSQACRLSFRRITNHYLQGIPLAAYSIPHKLPPNTVTLLQKNPLIKHVYKFNENPFHEKCETARDQLKKKLVRQKRGCIIFSAVSSAVVGILLSMIATASSS